MDIFVGLAVIVIILLGAIVMTLARLAASVASIGVAAAAISREVQETAQALRDHANGDAGISQQALNDLADKLDSSAASFNEAATQLDSLQSEIGSNADQSGAPSDSTASGLGGDSTASGLGGDSASGAPASDVDPAVTGDAGTADATGAPGADSAAGFGNQNGTGSDMEQGAGGEPVNLNSQSDSPADANEPPAGDDGHDADFSETGGRPV